MNWEAVEAISEAIGVIGVIVSLIYVGFQVKQSNRAMQAATVDQITGRFIGWMQHNTGDEAIGVAFREGLAAVATMSPTDRMKVFGVVQVMFKTIEAIHYQRVKGFVDDETWFGWQNWFANMKSYEVVCQCWKVKAPNHSQDFRGFWDALPARADTSLGSLVDSLR